MKTINEWARKNPKEANKLLRKTLAKEKRDRGIKEAIKIIANKKLLWKINLK